MVLFHDWPKFHLSPFSPNPNLAHRRLDTTNDMAEAAAMSAAEKRAARRARVLQGGESRLKLVTGQISSLKAEEDAAERQLERQMDEQAAELLADAGVSADLKVPTRVDPAQRRRDAAARRRKKEEAVQELLGGKKLDEEQEKPQEEVEDAESKPSSTPVAAQGDKSDKPSGFSRHYLALQLQVAQDKAVALLILLAAVYIAMTVDLRAIIADLRLDDELLRSYQDLLARGIPIESIKQRLEREHLDHDEQVRIEQFLFTQQRSAALANDVSSADGLIPSFWDVSAFLETLVAHPPIIVGVFLLRVLIAAVAGAAHSILKLPDVKKPQEDDLGFVMNLALSSRPALKGYVVKLRKSADDLFLFLFVLVVTIAVRALWFA